MAKDKVQMNFKVSEYSRNLLDKLMVHIINEQGVPLPKNDCLEILIMKMAEREGVTV
jgi:hypothetical protein